jgi:hypothetical protein
LAARREEDKKMMQLTKIADRLLSVVAPKATAAACSGCTYAGPYSGPCAGGYGYYKCCYYNEPGGCTKKCSFVC